MWREGWREACLDEALALHLPFFPPHLPGSQSQNQKSQSPSERPVSIPDTQLGCGKRSEAAVTFASAEKGPSSSVWRGARLTWGPGPCELKKMPALMS